MKITIVGGGTAGWIAAFFIANAQPGKHEIVVVESSEIGIIGAGEGSTGSFLTLINGGFFKYKCDVDKFIRETDATPKMGIKHNNWSVDGDSYYAPLDVSPTAFTPNDYIFKHVFSKYGKEKMHLASEIGINFERKTYRYDAFHFDGHKVGNFFKNECKRHNVKIYDSIVKNVNLDDHGNIKSINLDDNYELESDLFIDCTGFSRVLMNKVDSSWISKKDVLPMNTAMPFVLNYSKEDENNILPVTQSTALSSGWMWNIPLSTRKGCGYVFDSNFISVDDAKKEVETFLKKEIEPIKIIKFEAGYSSHFWKNNVICLGLSSSFVEPLEATSIHNTIMQICIFVNEFLDTTKESTNVEIKQNIYNKRITFLNELTTDFISLHYQGGKENTEFWKHIKNNNIVTDLAASIIEQAKYKIPGYTTMEGMFGSFSIPLANWNLAGMGLIKREMAEKELRRDSRFLDSEDQYNNFFESV
jgi:flavin-dependent dehydrogenase